MSRPIKSKRKFCIYCTRERSVKLFPPESDICNFCLVFDKAAQLTAPTPPTNSTDYTYPQLDTYQESQVQ